MIKTEKPQKQYVRSLTTGWRFTLPSQIRKSRGWENGTVLQVDIDDDRISLSEASHEPGKEVQDNNESVCYLGSGGKIVVPAAVRQKTGWRLGERLSITEQPDGVEVAACCQKNRCRSCGELHRVIEVIDNLFLCQKCWQQYLLKSNM